jgi:hypothetical protein
MAMCFPSPRSGISVHLAFQSNHRHPWVIRVHSCSSVAPAFLFISPIAQAEFRFSRAVFD